MNTDNNTDQNVSISQQQVSRIIDRIGDVLKPFSDQLNELGIQHSLHLSLFCPSVTHDSGELVPGLGAFEKNNDVVVNLMHKQVTARLAEEYSDKGPGINMLVKTAIMLRQHLETTGKVSDEQIDNAIMDMFTVLPSSSDITSMANASASAPKEGEGNAQ